MTGRRRVPSRTPPVQVEVPVLICWCGQPFRDDQAGRSAHAVIAGHKPEQGTEGTQSE